MLPPPAATNPITPIALARSPGSTNSVITSDSATAATIAPPTPCTARAATSSLCAVERPQATDDAVNSTRPVRNSLRCP